MARRPLATRDGIEAASRTYNRCTDLLRKELDLDPIDLGLGPRDTFEETVTLLRAKLQSQGNGLTSEKHHLNTDDFSFNEVLRLMRLTAIKQARRKRRLISREDFIREVNDVLQEEGGLEIARRLVPNGRTGRYAWIESHMQIFLRRHSDVARRSKKYPKSVRIVVVRSEDGRLTFAAPK